MARPLLGTEARVYRFINDYIVKVGFPPTFREIAAGTDLRSLSTVSKYVTRLQGAGYVDFQPGCPRTLRILK